ncbi:hypothetical protein Clacol_010163 [Clathrus columnatus]|uniref:Uncharacterized protein n=1 Tax=Clathrus columnatus TaxID=1419009 RepID=A0AAV5AN59_9AGAM|nr:hypothetical protein Clacol_010163 [Clathrus columnatus]
MSVPFPSGPYAIVNNENGNINAVSPGPIIPVVAEPEVAIFVISDYKPLAGEDLGFDVHHLVNITKGGQPANLKLAFITGNDVTPSDNGTVAIFDSAVPNVWCIHPSEKYPGKYLIYFSRYGTINHGPCHWHLESSKPGTPVIVNADKDHPINKVLRAHISAGRGASRLADLTQKLDELEEHHHHPDCYWYLRQVN